MASKKRKSSASSSSQVRFDRSRFHSQEAWDRYNDIVVPRKLLPERNVVVYHTEFDEFKEELERRKWDEELTSFDEGSIDVVIVKEFYANLYDPDDKSPKQVQVRGHLIKFDEDTLNTFLKTPMIIEEGETLSTYSRFSLLRPDPQELVVKLCIPRRGFELNVDGQPLKILRKNMTTLAQTWSVLSYSNLVPTSHTSDITLDRAKLIYGIIMKMDMNLGYLISHQISIIAQHDSSRLGFPSLITTLYDPTVTFRGPRKARGKRFEAPPTSTAPDASAPSSSTLPDPSAPFTSTPHLPQFPPGVQPSPSGGGGASAAQEPDSAEPVEEHTEEQVAKEPVLADDELTPLEPFSFAANTSMAQKEETSPDPMLEPSHAPPSISEDAPISEDTMPSAPAMEPEQPILQDVPAAPVLDLNEDQPQDEQDV
ncbi:hypothetical protein HKD37_11G032367 [Glycine soja]|nr:hypothetical protein GmHk_11G033052 [Glycine max]